MKCSSKWSNLVSLRLICRHELPTRFGEEMSVYEKLLYLLRLESVYFLLSKEWEDLPLFHDKLLAVDEEDTVPELDNMSTSSSFSFALDEMSPPVLFPASFWSDKIVSLSEPELNSSETSSIEWSSNIDRTAAVAFSALFLCRDTTFNCSSSSETCNRWMQFVESVFPYRRAGNFRIGMETIKNGKKTKLGADWVGNDDSICCVICMSTYRELNNRTNHLCQFISSLLCCSWCRSFSQ